MGRRVCEVKLGIAGNHHPVRSDKICCEHVYPAKRFTIYKTTE